MDHGLSGCVAVSFAVTARKTSLIVVIDGARSLMPMSEDTRRGDRLSLVRRT
jgi:hypothetical protein